MRPRQLSSLPWGGGPEIGDAARLCGPDLPRVRRQSLGPAGAGIGRREAPDVALHVVADYSPSPMRQLADGAMVIGIMYEPRQMAGLVIEDLLVDDLFLFTTGKACTINDETWGSGYTYVDRRDAFKQRHEDAFPDLAADITAGLGSIALGYIMKFGGSAFLPLRLAYPLIRGGHLTRVRGASAFHRMGSVTYSSSPTDPDLLQLDLRGLREAKAQIENQTRDLTGFFD